MKDISWFDFGAWACIFIIMLCQVINTSRQDDAVKALQKVAASLEKYE